MAEAWDRALAHAPEFDEVVIWLEHDLFDQILLARHLAWFAERPSGGARPSLICVGEWPGMPEVTGLGGPAPAELAALSGTRRRVTQRQLALGRRAWRAFTATDPRALDRLVAEEDTSALEFLAPALRRFLEDYPWVGDGLSRTDRQLLRTITAGVTDVGALWRAQHRWRRTGSSPTSRSSAGCARSPERRTRWSRSTRGGRSGGERGVVTLTDEGRAVLGGGVGVAARGGVDRWYGGVHLEGTAPAWRWDGARGRIDPGAAR